ncbi:serine/threonine-protein kinase [Mitsuaria sp. GD03876]|uniref:serine/threonine protein kinase n=1 Tax=Mitsuaria sp. GD03876 TaxID=2975399 RepID=UPI00244D6F9E|nr:serine/threonine-protein kinase [Mitsuaria sp. GD03876]MDH0862989.1 serine/threonine protein kinase [Mitsuaria sp. GD03876]
MSSQLNLDQVAAQLCQQCGFEFRGLLGKGAFKSAYLAVHQHYPFALKIAAVSGGADRLMREAEALKECSHPSIAKLLQAFSYAYGPHQLWVVYEDYLGGGTLESRLRISPLTAHDVRSIGIRLAEVLGHLDDKRLVHRDIKPANIMFRGVNDVDPVLTDFGIVRMLNQPTLTQAFMQMGPGTPAYAAPEQLTNDKSLIDWRTDQFGLGIVLAECLLGHHPFLTQGQSINDAIHSVAARQEVPAINAQRLRELGFDSVTRALRSWPIARFRKPIEFVDALMRN